MLIKQFNCVNLLETTVFVMVFSLCFIYLSRDEIYQEKETKGRPTVFGGTCIHIIAFQLSINSINTITFHFTSRSNSHTATTHLADTTSGTGWSISVQVSEL